MTVVKQRGEAASASEAGAKVVGCDEALVAMSSSFYAFDLFHLGSRQARSVNQSHKRKERSEASSSRSPESLSVQSVDEHGYVDDESVGLTADSDADDSADSSSGSIEERGLAEPEAVK